MKIVDLAFKDLTRSVRSLFAVGMMIAAPLLLIGLIFFAFGGMSQEETDIPPVVLGVVNADSQPVDSVLQEALGDTIRSLFFDESVLQYNLPSPESLSTADFSILAGLYSTEGDLVYLVLTNWLDYLSTTSP